MAHSYLIRYGLTAARVARFVSDTVHQRGETVVIWSHRGTELGEVLAEAVPGLAVESEQADGLARILRTAGPVDLARAGVVERDRASRYQACARILGEGAWPLDLIDVEPLLDDGRTVLYYLGPHHLDTTGLRAAFRNALDLDVLFEPVGLDLSDEDSGSPTNPPTHEPTHDACGSCAAASHGGCSTGGCGSGSACGDCGVQKLLAARR
jgi:hypothetical protein